MLRVIYTCLTGQHDTRLVILAVVVCLFSCITAINLFARADERIGLRRQVFASLAAVVFGAGVWATHFVAELAFNPGLPIAYDFGLTAASMAIAIGIAWLGFVLALQCRRPLVGGAVIGLAIVAMHYSGLAALRVPAAIEWNAALVVVSIGLGVAGAAAAVWLLCRRPSWHYRFYAAAMLVAAICGLHFTAMAALVLVPDASIAAARNALDPVLLAPVVAAISIAIVSLSLLVSILEEHSARRMARDAEQLRQSEAHLARVLRISGIGCVQRDLQTGRLEWSPEARVIFGIGQDERVDARDDFYRFVHPDDRATVEAATRDSDRGLASPPLEYRIVRPSGEIRTVYRENDVVRDDAGQPLLRISIFKDITELKATEAELRRAVSNLEHAQRLSHTGSMTRYLATDEVEWSDEMYRIFGVTRDGFHPSTPNFMKLVVAEDRPKLVDARDRIAAGNRPPSFEYRIQRPDGNIRHLYRETEIIEDERGTAIGFLTTLQDVTEARLAEARQRELERELQHSQRLEALGTLAGGIAHDLNNTLVPILTLGKMLLSEPVLDDSFREDIELIVRSSERARDLVKQILEFSRKEESVLRTVDLAALAGEALRMLRAAVPATIRFVEQIEAVPPLSGDPSGLHQVVLNLVTNAAQAIGPRQGTITLALRPARGGILLSVADTGTGMDEPTLERIFEPFFTTKPVGEGTGLGLSVVHGIIVRHGGRIDVKSAPTVGTEVTVTLPTAAAPAEAISAAA